MARTVRASRLDPYEELDDDALLAELAKRHSDGELLKTFRARRKANPHKHYVPNGKVEEFITLVGANETFISLFSATLWCGRRLNLTRAIPTLYCGLR
jgi:50S ribosomal subunit-associated GTPase HflX